MSDERRPEIETALLRVAVDGISAKLLSLDAKLERMDGRLDNIDVTLGKQQVSLDEHIRRTEALEKTVEPLKERDMLLKTVFKLAAVLLGGGGLGFALSRAGLLTMFMKLFEAGAGN